MPEEPRSDSQPEEPVAPQEPSEPQESWWGRRSKRAKVAMIAGAASVVALAGLAVFLVLFLQPAFVVEAIEVPDAIVYGEDISVAIDVANEGRVSGEYELCVLVDGQETETKLVTLDAGTQQEVSITLSGLQADRYDIGVAEWPELVRQVWVMTPADIRMGPVLVQPDPIDINASNEAEMSVKLTNAGEATGSYELAATLGDEVLETREVEVAGGASVEESFGFEVASPGSCQVAINGECVDVEIYQLGRPENGEKLVKDKIIPLYKNLKIENNDDMDCLVVLVKQGKAQPYLAVYVRAQSECTVRVIVGTYDCYCSSGQDWCTYRNAFTKYQLCEKFDEPLKFRATNYIAPPIGSGQASYTVYTLEFGETTDGESSETSVVGPNEFPDI